MRGGAVRAGAVRAGAVRGAAIGGAGSGVVGRGDRISGIALMTGSAAANQVGAHPAGQHSGGRSLIVDPWGVVLAQAADGEGHIVADLDLDRIAWADGAVGGLHGENVVVEKLVGVGGRIGEENNFVAARRPVNGVLVGVTFGELADLFGGNVHDEDVQAAIVIEVREALAGRGLVKIACDHHGIA